MISYESNAGKPIQNRGENAGSTDITPYNLAGRYLPSRLYGVITPLDRYMNLHRRENLEFHIRKKDSSTQCGVNHFA